MFLLPSSDKIILETILLDKLDQLDQLSQTVTE
jgi:hypothetical protein